MQPMAGVPGSVLYEITAVIPTCGLLAVNLAAPGVIRFAKEGDHE